MNASTQSLSPDDLLFFSQRRKGREEAEEEEEEEEMERRSLFSSFFKTSCLWIPLKIVGCMYTAVVCGVCVVTARCQLAEAADVVLPACASIVSFLGALVCRTRLLISPGAFISSACNENKRRGRDPSPLSFSVFRFFSPPLSFFLFLVLSACLQLLGLAFFLYPLLHREFSATSASKERRTFLLLSLFFSHLLIACLHLYRHISKCRHVLLLSSRDPPSPPILLPFYLSLTLIEMLFHLLISLPVSFLLLLPFVSILNSFSSSSSSDYGAGDGSSFFFSSFLAGPLTALFVSFPFPSLSDCYVWISSFLLSIFFHFLLLFLFAIHAQLQQYANPAESLAVSASLAQLANMSTDMSNKTQQLNQLQFTSPRQKGRSFDNLILLSRWLRDCAKALEISLFSPDTFYFKSYVRKRHEEEAERKRLSVFSSSSISSSPSPSLAGRERREGERGQDGGEEEERRRERARDVGRKTEILQTRGAVRWSQFLETNESPLTLQRERCPLVPALEEFFSDCRYDDQFPLTLVPRSYDRSFPIKKETQKAGSSFLQTSTREGEETHAGSVPRRETANLVGEVMIERKLFGSPSVFCVYYENLVLDACEYYIGVLQTLQQSQLFFSPLYDKSAPRDSSSSSSFFFSSSPCKRRYERGEDFYTNANLSSFQRQKAAADQLAFSTFASPSSSSSVRHRKKEEQEEAKEREKIQQARHRACSAVIKSKTNREEKQRQDAPSSSFSFASKVRDFAEQEEETKKKKRHALVLLFISLLSWLSSFYHICVKKPFLSFLSFLDLLDEEEEEEGESYLTREREGGLTSLEEKETREKKKRRRRSRSEKGLVYEVEQREVCVLSGVCACALEGYTLWLCLKAKVEEEEEEEEEEERRAKGPEGGRRGEEAEERREILGASTRGKKRNDLYYHPLLGDSTYSILEARRFASLDSSAAKVAVKMLEVLREQDRLCRLCGEKSSPFFSSLDEPREEEEERRREGLFHQEDSARRDWLLGRGTCRLRYEVFECMKDLRRRVEQILLLMRNFRKLNLESLVVPSSSTSSLGRNSQASSLLLTSSTGGVCTALSPSLRSQLRRILNNPCES